MTRRLWQLPFTTALLWGLVAFFALAGNTYINDFANIEVTEPEYYEFDIFVSQESGSSAWLTLRVFDVDEEAGELDEIYINNTYLGYLSGTNETWSTSSFNIMNEIVYNANNTIRVKIDPGGGEANTWQATIDWGQILVDGGSADAADITSVSASGAWDSIQVQTSISSSTDEELRLELNLLDSANNNKDIFSEVFSLADGSSTTLNRTVALPSEPMGTEMFTIEANLFNHSTGVQQAIKTTTWTYSTSQPPTDISLSNESIDENLPALSLVGALNATDVDSGNHDFTLIGGDIGSFTITGDQLLSTLSFDHETRESYSLHIEAEDADENTISEWFTITVDDVNEAPTALADDASVVEGMTILVNVLVNDSDPDLDALTVVSVSIPSKGTATRQPDDTILYTPNVGACGTDSFTYAIEDGNGESASASVTMTLQNGAPTPVNDVATTPEGEPVLISVLANDSDPGGNAPTLQSVATPLRGTAVAVGDRILYKPVPRFEGSDRFSYTVVDNCGATATGWIDIYVTHTNHPPSAHAGGLYHGVVGEPLTLDASFSYDPDASDTLQYRWDLDGSGVADTAWVSSPQYATVYSAPFAGPITLEVRDLYRGVPTGEIAQATAFVRIASEQSIQVFVFEDLNGNGMMDSGEPGIAGVNVVIAGETRATEADGGISIGLNVGEWSVAITREAISNLESRGFAIPETERTVTLSMSAIEAVTFGVIKTSTALKGFVYVDLDENLEFDADVDQRLQGLRVILNDERKTLTDDFGSFFFLSVPFGNHILRIEENVEETDVPTDQEMLTITVPILLEREATNKFEIRWPWIPIGPDQGFLRINIEKSEDN